MINKKKLLPFLVLGLFAGESFADETGKLDMFVSGDLGYSHYSPDGAHSVSDSTYGFRGTAAYQDQNHFGAQVDGVFSHYDIGGSNVNNVDLAGHLFYRNDQFLIGGILQYRNPNLNLKSTGNYIYDWLLNSFTDSIVTEQVFWGAEGQAYFGDVTVSGQLAKQEFVNQKDFSGSKMLDDGYVANIKAKYFINDNWKVDVGFNYNKTNTANGFFSNDSFDQKTYTIGTEYRLADKPVSVYAQYNRNEMSISNYNLDTDQLTVGLKFNFGSTSLKERDRSGASLDPISQPPAGAVIFGTQLNGAPI
jgi:hypothetical protein